MKLSIITINYNNKEGLKKTIDSVIYQTWRDFEWIIVDGGSTDGSKELIEEYASKGCFSWWCSEPDNGVYNAMNKGISHANGEYLNFMNSGDVYYSTRVLENICSKNINADIIYSNAHYYTNKDSVVRAKPKQMSLNFLLHHALCHQSMLIKRSLFQIARYDERLKIVSDWKHSIICLLSGCSFGYTEHIIASCEGEGISSNINLLNDERGEVIKELISNTILIDEKELEEWRERECYNPELAKIYYLLNKRRLYKRIINGLIRFLFFIDNIKK